MRHLSKAFAHFSLFGILLFGTCGCAVLDGLFDNTVANENPRAWVPIIPSQTAASGEDRPLRTGDEVKILIRLPDAMEVSPVSDVVDALGNVTLSFVGEVRVGGLTTSEAETVIRDTYIREGYFNSLNVTVICPTMMSESTRTVSVTGCVFRRGEIPFRDGLTLREAIIIAGDLNDFASGTILLTRNGVTEKYDYSRIKAGREKDPYLRPRDIIEAKESRF